MSENSEIRWLSVPEAAQRLGVRDRDVRAMMREQRILAVRREAGKGPQIPEGMIVEGEAGPEVLASLRGTLMLLSDCGLDEDEAMRWLLSAHERLDATPLEALRSGRTHVVRDQARTLLL